MTSPSFHLAVQEWPSRNDLSDFLHQSNSQEEIRNFLTQEFDTTVQFRVDEHDLLDGYPEAFILPLHAFAQSMSSGLKQLDDGGEATIPIYLQQYEVSEGDPSHTMKWKVDGSEVELALEWGGDSDTPSALAQMPTLRVERAEFRRQLAGFLDTYTRKIAMLLGSFPDWTGEQIAELFSSF